jgi:hypothetical protein
MYSILTVIFILFLNINIGNLRLLLRLPVPHIQIMTVLDMRDAQAARVFKLV